MKFAAKIALKHDEMKAAAKIALKHDEMKAAAEQAKIEMDQCMHIQRNVMKIQKREIGTKMQSIHLKIS
jgi:hypothetical protein